MINRRKFLSFFGTAAVGLPFIKSTTSAQSGPASQPNLLFIITDQQFADMIAGISRIADPLGFSTPNMDRLLASGVRFDRAYATQPLCVPCRNSLFTGRYPHETGITINRSYEPGVPGGRIPAGIPMLGGYLQDAGYDCGYVGKWHLLAPNTNDPSGSTHGFPFVRYALANGIDPDVVPGCREFFNQWSGSNPFCLVASWVNPHDICEYARNESGNYNDPLPNGAIGSSPPADPAHLPSLRPNHDPAGEPPALVRLRDNPDNLTWLDRLYPTNDYTETNWRRYMWAYHRLVEKVDSQIGELLDELDARGLTGNTTIVFTSDHGEGYGSHLWNQKQCFYEEVARVPFIVSGAGVTNPGTTDSSHLLSICLDIIPTLLDFAGAPIPSQLPGASVKPLVTGQAGAATWRDHCVLQTEFGGWGTDQQSGVKGRCVVTDQYKYVCYEDSTDPGNPDNEQLFHLPTDPGEVNNLAGSTDHRILLHQLRRALLDYMDATGDAFPARPSAYANPEGTTNRRFLRLRADS
ncbi:MAG: sulfatase family protein [Oceanipulchritudo sp.]